MDVYLQLQTRTRTLTQRRANRKKRQKEEKAIKRDMDRAENRKYMFTSWIWRPIFSTIYTVCGLTHRHSGSHWRNDYLAGVALVVELMTSLMQNASSVEERTTSPRNRIISDISSSSSTGGNDNRRCFVTIFLYIHNSFIRIEFYAYTI